MQRLPLPVRNEVQWNHERFLSLLERSPTNFYPYQGTETRGSVQDPTRHPLPTFPSDFAVILELGWGWEWQKSLTLCDTKPDFSFLSRRSSNPIDDSGAQGNSAWWKSFWPGWYRPRLSFLQSQAKNARYLESCCRWRVCGSDPKGTKSE